MFETIKEAIAIGKQAGREGRSVEDVTNEWNAKARGETYNANVYHPSKVKDGMIRADIYSTYGTHDLDKWFEQGAPHLTDAIYEIRDDIKKKEKNYDELKGRYDELERSYNHLQKQYETLTNILENMSKSNVESVK